MSVIANEIDKKQKKKISKVYQTIKEITGEKANSDLDKNRVIFDLLNFVLTRKDTKIKKKYVHKIVFDCSLILILIKYR